MSPIPLRRPWFLPTLVCIGLIVWAWDRLGFFTFNRMVATEDGQLVRAPNALATVDHPFHAARFGQFLDALRDGHLPNWIFSHQGGYPSEFYPFGSSLVDLGIWLITFDQMPIPMVHTWAVAIVFALPVVGFLLLAHFSDLSIWIAPVALVAHISIRGWWWSGGSMELIEWGLVTNVLAATLAFIALIAIGGLIDGRSRRLAGVAALAIGWAGFTNPRSLIAILTIVAAAVIVRKLHDHNLRTPLPTVAAPIILGLGLVSPILAPLIRYNELYFFVNYSAYAGVQDWLDSSIQAVSGPVFVVTCLGLVMVMARQRTVIEELLGWTAVLYSALTIYLATINWPASWTDQLESTRLMPFQRLLMIALATVAVGRIAKWMSVDREAVICGTVAGLILLLYVISPPGLIPESDRGLVRIGSMATPGIADLRSAVVIADNASPATTAILILGTTEYWHDHLWATLWSDRLFYYDDWLWYWQQEHIGNYDPETEHAYQSDSSTIDPVYLAEHGIGAIVVTGVAQSAAADAPFLNQVRTGTYDVYLVKDPTTMATLGGSDLQSRIVDNQIAVSEIETGGTATIRVNWFPRWSASVDGRDVPVVHRSDGYMDIQIPEGSSELMVRYQRTKLDWLTLVVSIGSAAGIAGLFLRVKPIAPSEPQ